MLVEFDRYIVSVIYDDFAIHGKFLKFPRPPLRNLFFQDKSPPPQRKKGGFWFMTSHLLETRESGDILLQENVYLYGILIQDFAWLVEAGRMPSS